MLEYVIRIYVFPIASKRKIQITWLFSVVSFKVCAWNIMDYSLKTIPTGKLPSIIAFWSLNNYDYTICRITFFFSETILGVRSCFTICFFISTFLCSISFTVIGSSFLRHIPCVSFHCMIHWFHWYLYVICVICMRLIPTLYDLWYMYCKPTLYSLDYDWFSRVHAVQVYWLIIKSKSTWSLAKFHPTEKSIFRLFQIMNQS